MSEQLVAGGRRDLVALVADQGMEQAVRGLLLRGPAIGFRAPDAEVFVHPGHDSGCRADAHAILRPLARQYDFALVMFDREGSGAEEERREVLEESVETQLHTNGWESRSAAVVLDPELEIWVWTDSSELDNVIGWAGKNPPLRTWLANRGYDFTEVGKPARPKEAFRAALKHVKKRPSSAFFRQLAERVGVDRCTDAAFSKLKRTLCAWFPR